MADEEDRIIWAWREDHGDIWTGEWAPPGEDHIPDHAQEYITRAEADAMVAAAFRMAAELPAYDGDGDPSGPFDHKVFVKIDAILSLTPSDAAAALDEVRREAVRQAAERLALNVEVLDAMGRWEWPATTEGKVKFILAAMEERK